MTSGDEALDLFFHRYAGQNQFRHHIGVTYVAVAGCHPTPFHCYASPASPPTNALGAEASATD